MEESIGAGNGKMSLSHKTAYCLIYINQFIADQMDAQEFPMHQMKDKMPIDNNLRQQITISNNSFLQEQERFRASKVID